MVAIPAAVVAQRTAVSPALVFDGVTVIDVEHGQPLPAQRVVIAGPRIQAVGAANAVPLPAGAQVIDARGKYLIPGLWDLHTHLTPYEEGSNLPAPLAYELFLANGVTGIRDAGSYLLPLDTAHQWRREILTGTRVGPPRQIFSGRYLEMADGCNTLQAYCVADPAAAVRYVDSMHAAGVDMIKLHKVTPAVYFAVAAEARRLALPFGGHLAMPWTDTRVESIPPVAASDSGATIADHIGVVQVGVLDSLCFHAPEATVTTCRPVAEHFRRNNTWSVPMLSQHISSTDRLLRVALDSLWAGAVYDAHWLAPEMQSYADSLSSPDFAPLRLPREVGLPIAAGGDTPPEESGFRLHAELAALVIGGLTPALALQAATLNPAKAFQLTDSLGTVATGKLADLVLLDASPLADITNTTMVRAVVANGRYYSRAALDALLKDVRARNQQP